MHKPNKLESYQLLEKEFAEWCGIPNCIACNSGTAALHLALESLGLPPGSQVLVPEFTYVACARACSLAGLHPVFVDCTDDLLMDLTAIDSYVTERTRAIMAVHIYGRRLDMDLVSAIARRKDLFVIEDRAECPIPFGDYVADATCWSFYKNKVVHGEEGGMVAYPHNLSQASKSRLLRNQGSRGDYLHCPRAHNYRLANTQASLVRSSLALVDENLRKRREVEQVYNRRVDRTYQMPNRLVPWVYDICLPLECVAATIAQLSKAQVEFRCSFKPMSMQPEYIGHYRHLRSYRHSQQVLCLPIDPSMSEQDVAAICDCLPQP